MSMVNEVALLCWYCVADNYGFGSVVLVLLPPSLSGFYAIALVRW